MLIANIDVSDWRDGVARLVACDSLEDAAECAAAARLRWWVGCREKLDAIMDAAPVPQGTRLLLGSHVIRLRGRPSGRQLKRLAGAYLAQRMLPDVVTELAEALLVAEMHALGLLPPSELRRHLKEVRSRRGKSWVEKSVLAALAADVEMVDLWLLRRSVVGHNRFAKVLIKLREMSDVPPLRCRRPS